MFDQLPVLFRYIKGYNKYRGNQGCDCFHKTSPWRNVYLFTKVNIFIIIWVASARIQCNSNVFSVWWKWYRTGEIMNLIFLASLCLTWNSYSSIGKACKSSHCQLLTILSCYHPFTLLFSDIKRSVFKTTFTILRFV